MRDYLEVAHQPRDYWIIMSSDVLGKPLVEGAREDSGGFNQLHEFTFTLEQI